MRYTPIAATAAILMLMASSTSIGAPADVNGPINALSLQMQQEAERLRTAGETEAATGYYESALVADPRNVAALIGMGDMARARDLPGKAVTYYRDALALRPDDRDATAGLVAAYVARGATERARTTLAQLQQLCGGDNCPQIAELTASINNAGQRTALRPAEVLPTPIVENTPTAQN